MEPELFEVYESGSPDDEVSVIIRMAPGVEPPATVRVVSRFDDILTARIRRAEIVPTRESSGVISMKASTVVSLPRPFESVESRDIRTPDVVTEDNVEAGDVESRPGGAMNAVLPSLAEDGRGVVVGICDWGFDFTHPNFRNADGTTRLLCLWDQRGFGDPRAPAPYNRGRLLTRGAINAALATPDPCATLGYHPASGDPTDTGSHGTHVADILAGNRREPGSEVGLASGADIVFVHLGAPGLGELANLGDSVGLLEGLDFCRRQAAGRPCVLHLSAGKTGGEKRGVSPLERAVDAMLKQPGIALVQSVGNYANTAMHTQARVGPDQHYVFNWIIPADDPTRNVLEVWYSGEDVFDATLFSPSGREFAAALDHRVQLEDGGSVLGNFYHRRHEPNSGLNHIAIYMHPGAPGGMWRLAVHGRDVVDGRLHAWIERDASRRWQSRFLAAQASSHYTTNTICNCFRAIAVGAYDGTRRERPGTLFSSQGPTADGRQKPELVAPGYMIRAARSLPRNGWRDGESRLCVKSGTSMAAPWVSGTVALMMQAAGRPLTIHEIRRALIGSLDPHGGPSGRTSTKLGYGYLNTPAAVEAARRLGRAEQTPAVTQSAGPLFEETGWAPVWVEDASAPAGEAERTAEAEAAVEVEQEADESASSEGWAPVWVEDASAPAAGAERTAEAEAVVEVEEADEPASSGALSGATGSCGCTRAVASLSPANRETVRGAEDEATGDEEDETESFETEPAEEPIEAFGWDDLRDVLEVLDESEEPA